MRLGRLLDPSRDELDGAEPVAVLSYGFWERQFGADPSVVGRTIHLNGKPVTVIGVAGIEFSGLSLEGPDVWMPITHQPYFVNGSKLLTDYSVEGSGVTVWGRLRPGVTPEAAQDELRSLAAALRPQHPNDIWENETLPASPGAYATSAINRSHHGTGARDPDPMVPAAALIGALVLLILAVACGNLGSLLLARGFAREREIAIRAAVGAGKGRLVRQLFTESLLLGLLGSAAGLVLGYIILRSLIVMSGTPAWLNPAPDWRVILFAAVMAFAAAILFGLTPAFQVLRQRHQASLVRQILIGGASGRQLRAADCRRSSGPGAEPGIGRSRLRLPAAWSRSIRLSATRVHSRPSAGVHRHAARPFTDLPGVRSVALATNPPFGNKTVTIGMVIRGRAIHIHPNMSIRGTFRR